MLNNYTCQECKMEFDQKINYNKDVVINFKDDATLIKEILPKNNVSFVTIKFN